MKKVREFLFRLRALFRRERLDAEMREEMQHHLEMSVAEQTSQGKPADEAAFAARRRFGGVEQVREQARDQRSAGWMEQAVRDVRHGARGLRRTPGFTFVAGSTLALGIGLVAIQFSFVNGALFKGLPFEDSDRVVSVTPINSRGKARASRLGEFEAWREAQKSFAGFAAHARERLDLSGEGIDARNYRGAAFSAGVLEVLRVQPVIGRGFSLHDERPGAPTVVLLAHDVWQSQFGSDPGVLGRAIRVRGEPATVVGVLPPKFAFPENEEVWINLCVDAAGEAATDRSGASDAVEIVARLREGVALATARAEFDVLMAPALANASDRRALPHTARIWPFTRRPDNSKITIALLSLLGVAAGVLVIACVNVANLLSARALQRSHEMALRSALGASRGRIMRQMLTESSMLALLGATGGVLLAYWGVPLLNRGIAGDPAKPFWIEVQLDSRVLVATAVLTLTVGLLAGLFPALRASRGHTIGTLKEVAAGAGSARLGWINRALVVMQVGITCAVLLATGVLVDAVVRQARIDLPFDSSATLMADMRLSEREFPDQAARMIFQTTLLERVRSLPGVQAATLSRGYPLQRPSPTPLEVMGRAPEDDGAPVFLYHYNHAAPGFFRDARIPLREGRDFAASDNLQSERVTIVNERLARAFWPNESAIGKKIRRRAARNAPEEPWLTIVGVAANLAVDPPTHNGGMVLHVPLLQRASAQVTLLVTAAGEPRVLVRPIREIVRTLSADLPVENCQTVAEHFEKRGAPGRVFGLLALAFGASGLMLAAVGVYGVTAFAVHRRTREFGVRIALGAKPGNVLALVFRQGLRQLATGLVLGTMAGWLLARPLARTLARMAGPPGVEVYLVVFGGIALALAFALWWPARRAARVDPATALRAD